MRMLPDGYNAGDTIYVYFDTYGSSGESITITGLAVTDIEIYKDGSTTQRSSDNGYTLLDTDGIDFDGVTGLHGFSIDTSNNSDAGFWSDGSHYVINVNSITVNGQTVRFSFGLRLGILARPTTPGRKLDVSAGGNAGIDWGNVENPTSSAPDVNILNWASFPVTFDTDNSLPLVHSSMVSGTVAVASVGSGAITSSSFAANAITSSALATSAVDEIVDSVWDEDATAHQTQGTFGQAIGDPGATTRSIWASVTTALPSNAPNANGGLPVLSGGGSVLNYSISFVSSVLGFDSAALDEISGEVVPLMWDELLSSHTTAGTTGGALNDIGSILTAVDTEIAAIKTVTDQLIAAQSEPSAVPAANATPLQKIAWLGALARNKITQTATTQTLRNDADSGNIATSAVSDDGTTFTRSEWA